MSTITDLRATLFATLDGLKTGQIEVDKARAINDVAQTLINTAKVEVEYLKATGAQHGTGFIPSLANPDEAPGPAGDVITLPHGVRVVTHKIQG